MCINQWSVQVYKTIFYGWYVLWEIQGSYSPEGWTKIVLTYCPSVVVQSYDRNYQDS